MTGGDLSDEVRLDLLWLSLVFFSVEKMGDIGRLDKLNFHH